MLYMLGTQTVGLEPHNVRGLSSSTSNTGPTVPLADVGSKDKCRINTQHLHHQRCHWNSQNALIFYGSLNRFHYQTHFVL
jgi:hypothetical protein